MRIWDNTRKVPEPYKFIAALWLSFLVAIAATGLFFSVFHPRELLEGADLPILSDLAVYTIGFFAFWIMTAVSSLLSTYFLTSDNKG